MAKNVLLEWTNPASVADIDTIEIFRASGDETAQPDMKAFRTAAGSAIASEAVGSAGATQTYTDSGVAAGTYTYGAFSKNAGGFGPGDLIDTALVVT